jgi:hypothetical protein
MFEGFLERLRNKKDNIYKLGFKNDFKEFMKIAIPIVSLKP